MLSAMTLLLFLLLAAVLVAVLAKTRNTSAKKGHESFPVTIIRDGKTVTFDGYDTERLEREFAAATPRIHVSPALKNREFDIERMTVAITGALQELRAQVAIKINSTKNARFVERVFLDTDYLVAARTDTAKARAAAQNGTIVISEQQLIEYLNAGEFPHHERKQTHSGFNFDESAIVWEETYNPPVPCRLEYADSAGEYIERTVEIIHPSGKHPNGKEYLAAYEEGQIKTFRKDRILKLERAD
jgi:hypothetical protein